MDYNIGMIIFILIAGIGGFLVLAQIAMKSWQTGSIGKEEADARFSRGSREIEICYNNCMRDALWDSEKSHECDSMCRTKFDYDALKPAPKPVDTATAPAPPKQEVQPPTPPVTS